MCSVWCASCVVCNVQCAVCSVQCAVCSVQCVVCSNSVAHTVEESVQCAVDLDEAQMVRRQVLAGDRAWHTPPITATNGRALYCTYMHYIVLELQLSTHEQSTLQWLVGRDSGEELGRKAKDANGDTGSVEQLAKDQTLQPLHWPVSTEHWPVLNKERKGGLNFNGDAGAQLWSCAQGRSCME